MLTEIVASLSVFMQILFFFCCIVVIVIIVARLCHTFAELVKSLHTLLVFQIVVRVYILCWSGKNIQTVRNIVFYSRYIHIHIDDEYTFSSTEICPVSGIYNTRRLITTKSELSSSTKEIGLYISHNRIKNPCSHSIYKFIYI